MPSCHFYLRTGKCAFGKRCKWNHPTRNVAPYVMESQAAMGGISPSVLPLIPAMDGISPPVLSLIPFVPAQYPNPKMPYSPISPISPILAMNMRNVQPVPNKQYEFTDVYREHFFA